MQIRRAQMRDLKDILRLLKQVNRIHFEGRPDLFKEATKYTPDQLKDIICDDARPVLVADDGGVVGYAFCTFIRHENDCMLTDVKTLYLDDLCVDETRRGGGVGKALYAAVINFAKESGCYNVTLNAWCLNHAAVEFYKRCGMQPLKICMEKIVG